MDITALAAWVLAHQELTTFIVQQVIFASLAGLLRALGYVKASKLFGTFAACDMGRVYTWLAAVLKQLPSKAKIAASSILFGVAFLGCAGTFEEAKMAGAKSRSTVAAVAPAKAPLSGRCASLSDRQLYFTGGGIVLAGLSAAAAGSSLALKSDDWDTALQLTSGISAVGAGGLTYLGSAAGTAFVQECQ